jgi:phospholipid/cholesterol/gamma-HCH transport system permease protein
MSFSPIRAVGGATVELLADTGRISRLFAEAVGRIGQVLTRRARFRWRATMAECVRAGYDTLPLVALILFLVGMIMALQSAYQLEQLGALNLVANLVAVSVSRELAPLLSAIIVAGRVGSAIAAELGTMKVEQEIDALTVMGIDPVSYLVVPRLLALVICLPCLTIFGDAVGILGGMAVGVGMLDMGTSGYIASTFDSLVLKDVITGLVKAVALGGRDLNHHGGGPLDRARDRCGPARDGILLSPGLTA